MKPLESVQNDTGFESICLRNRTCIPLYACAKEAVRQYRGPQDVSGQMQGCIDLPAEEPAQLNTCRTRH